MEYFTSLGDTLSDSDFFLNSDKYYNLLEVIYLKIIVSNVKIFFKKGM